MATQISTGVSKEILREGQGETPKVGQKITVHCTGSLNTKPPKKFWSTKDTNKPFSFNVGLKKVITGWDEGCMTMKPNEIARLTIDGPKAYGSQGFPAWGIPANATLIFEIEMLKIE